MIGRFCKILVGIALTWFCAATGLFLLHELNEPWRCHRPKERIARDKLAEMVMGIEEFELETDRCPTDNEELSDGRFVTRRSLVDPWGTAFGFSCHSWQFQVRSAGPDRIFGTADDITSER